jgi:hypothetical protein
MLFVYWTETTRISEQSLISRALPRKSSIDARTRKNTVPRGCRGVNLSRFEIVIQKVLNEGDGRTLHQCDQFRNQFWRRRTHKNGSAASRWCLQCEQRRAPRKRTAARNRHQRDGGRVFPVEPQQGHVQRSAPNLSRFLMLRGGSWPVFVQVSTTRPGQQLGFLLRYGLMMPNCVLSVRWQCRAGSSPIGFEAFYAGYGAINRLLGGMASAIAVAAVDLLWLGHRARSSACWRWIGAGVSCAAVMGKAMSTPCFSHR